MSRKSTNRHEPCKVWIDLQVFCFLPTVLWSSSACSAMVNRLWEADVFFNHSVMSNSLWHHGLQQARLPCPSPSPGTYSCPLSWWCHNHLILCHHLLLLPSVITSLRAFSNVHSLHQMAKVLEFPLQHPSFQMNIQGWFYLGLTSLTSLQSKGLSRVFYNTTVQKGQFFSARLSLWPNTHINIWLLEKT